MVKIYTQKGDDGTTGLWYGGRVPKTDARTEAYGSIDEANSALGVARALCKKNQSGLASDLLQLQQDLFVAGAELATAPEAADRLEDGVSRVTDGMVDAVEVDIDRYMRQVDLPPQFVIPGGTELSAALDVARSADPPRRAPRRRPARRRGPRLRGRARATSTAPRTWPSRWRASPTRRTRSCSTGKEGVEAMRNAVARRRKGFETEVEIRGHRLIVDETDRRRGRRRRPQADRDARRRARLLHDDHDRHVRRPQGLGRRRDRGRRRLQDALRRTKAPASRSRSASPPQLTRRAARADPGDRRPSARCTRPSRRRTSRSTTASS